MEVQYSVDSAVPHLIEADAKRLRQVLFNLLSNATKFTQKGDLTVRVKLVHDEERARTSPSSSPSSAAPLYTLQFSVTDTGMGISAEGQSRLFKPFSQVHADAARLSGGTGLGLVISKQLVQLMGGTMWLESEVGKGSTFYFTIQCKASDHNRPAWIQPITAINSQPLFVRSHHPSCCSFLPLCLVLNWSMACVSV